MTPQIAALDHLVLTVDDIDHTVEFYTGVLGMRVESFDHVDGTTRTAVLFGRQKINLHRAGAEFEPKARQPAAGSGDLCFLSETPLGEWQAHLARHDVAIELGPIARIGAAGPLSSLYMRDPDGNLIEISNVVRDQA